MNDNLHSLPDFPLSVARRTEDLLRDVYTDNLIYRVEQTVTITDPGDGVAGAVRGAGSPAQLITRTDLNWDNTSLFDVNGPELRKLTGINAAQAIRETRLTSAAPGVYVISGDYMINFARRDLLNPFETNLPPLPVRQQFRVGVEWDQTRTNNTSSPGSGSLVSGGTHVVTISNARVQIVQNYAKDGHAPFYIPVITGVDSEQFYAANPRLRFPLRSTRKFNALLLHCYQNGDLLDDVDLIETVSFLSGNDAYLKEQDRDLLRSATLYRYPGMPADAGWLYLPMAAGGKLGNAVDPVKLSNPAFEFNVSAPDDNPGIIRALFLELIKIEGITADAPFG